jgi:hypothetical protein
VSHIEIRLQRRAMAARPPPARCLRHGAISALMPDDLWSAASSKVESLLLDCRGI